MTTAAARSPLTGRLLAVLTLAIAVVPYSSDTFLPAMPAAATALAVGVSAVQVTLTALLGGIAVGQLVFGPLSDRVGRRRPMLVGLALCAAAGLLAWSAPSLPVLVAARFVQGFAASAGMVLSRTVLRDLTSGAATVRALAVVAAGTGVLYVFAPVLGGLVLTWLGWRGPLLLVVAFSAAVLVVAAVAVPETLPPAARDARPIRPAVFLRHLRNRPFVAFLGVQAMSYGALMAYVSASPFVFTGLLGVSAADYGVLFAVNQATAVVLSIGSVAVLRRVAAEWVPVAGLAVSGVGVVATALGFLLHAPLPVLVVAITVSMATLALNNAPLTGMGLGHVAAGTGAAAALCGCAQFVTGAVVTPLVGLAGSGTPWPSLGTMAAMLIGAGALLAVTLRRLRAAHDPVVDLELGEAVAQG